MAATTRRDARRITYQPALDGLRAVAVMAVLLYHQHRGPGIGRVGRGGFLGVDVFFVLSGYLITSLLLQERVSSGTVAFGRFWGRRARRLLPALLVMLVLVAVLGTLVYSAGQRQKIHDDLPYTLFYLENWHIALWHGSAQSAIGHTWSLSVEEQFYLIWPAVLVGLVAATRGALRRLASVLLVLAVASAVWTAVWLSPLRAFFGTDARAQELLVGATLAAIAASVGLTVPERFRRLLGGAGAVLLVCVVVLLLGAPASPEFWQRGGTLVFAIGTALLIAAAVQGHGTARVILAAPILVAIGQISYGLYLFHLPVYAWINSSTGLSQVPLFVVRVGITFAIAIASYRLVEQPIRKGRFSWRVLVPVGACVAIGVLLLTPAATITSVPPPRSKLLGFALTSAADAAPPDATRVLVVGGERASLLSLASKGPVGIGSMWGISVGTPRCGLTSGSPRCRAVPDDLPAIAAAFRANAVVLMPDEDDLAGFSAGTTSEDASRALTARLESMRRALGPRRLGIVAVTCLRGPADARDALATTVAAWARRHRVAIGSSGTDRCAVDAPVDTTVAATWRSIARLATATRATR